MRIDRKWLQARSRGRCFHPFYNLSVWYIVFKRLVRSSHGQCTCGISIYVWMSHSIWNRSPSNKFLYVTYCSIAYCKSLVYPCVFLWIHPINSTPLFSPLLGFYSWEILPWMQPTVTFFPYGQGPKENVERPDCTGDCIFTGFRLISIASNFQQLLSIQQLIRDWVHGWPVTRPSIDLARGGLASAITATAHRPLMSALMQVFANLIALSWPEEKIFLKNNILFHFSFM